ncbi:UDP-N-acteylglucosamine pyrophosphorylase 1 [Cunninghamella echinulata]|nr:UDP-N-acteylglucosamine pyrophosphorylase 1 [Cunninghamella echinulata]
MTVELISKSNIDVATLKAKFDHLGQGHVFQFYQELDEAQQESLLKQLNDIDVERLNGIYEKAIQASEDTHQGDNVEGLTKEVFDTVLFTDDDKDKKKKDIQQWETLGLSLIAQNKVAVILMAGGQGTRLGSSDPKGCYDINLPSKKSLFQLQAERILRLQEVAKQYTTPQALSSSNDIVIPWYIMTSGPTHQPTVDYFKKNNYFGLKQENITFFEQGNV